MAQVPERRAIMQALYTILTDDSALKTAMGGTVRLYPKTAPKDATKPYVCHWYDVIVQPDHVIADGTYYCALYDYGTAYRIWEMADRIETLLDQRALTTADNEIKGGRMFCEGKDEPGEGGSADAADAEKARYMLLSFALRYARNRQITNILARG